MALIRRLCVITPYFERFELRKKESVTRLIGVGGQLDPADGRPRTRQVDPGRRGCYFYPNSMGSVHLQHIAYNQKRPDRNPVCEGMAIVEGEQAAVDAFLEEPEVREVSKSEAAVLVAGWLPNEPVVMDPRAVAQAIIPHLKQLKRVLPADAMAVLDPDSDQPGVNRPKGSFLEGLDLTGIP